MMADIFSSFDPATCSVYSSFSPSIFWMLTFFSFSMVQASLWTTSSRFSWLPTFPIEMMNAQASRTFGLHLKGFPSILSSLFLMLIILNLMGLLPYVFSSTSHLLLTLSLGLPLWMSLIISAIIFAPKSFTAHLLPGGAPDWLNPFLVITETLSICMRFITLSFRIAANMSAGHILLGLMGIAASSSIFTSIFTSSSVILIQLGYTIFEMGICLIQAYIFCLLLSLYSDDHPSS
uniref:ATP synthase subunit a n=1 Tax=Halosydna sp. YZ-2018 TaxID=2153331 RepID=A0A343W6B0_9ANNE|nr:ATP synthase F0 subunit 6 [Harmothoe imbricata]AVW86132.1 ATP synthase F0 subunit 6 [Halosydna sp. YZ-2018]WKB17959.1 ATP synthase F0 subunit 6 [Harmothoe imbricata]